jgi:hypothetical protein
MIGEKSQLEYLFKRQKSYDKKYGMFTRLLEGVVSTEINVIELFGGVGIQTYLLDLFTKPKKHTVVERDEHCLRILKYLNKDKEVIEGDAFDYGDVAEYDLAVLDCFMNKGNMDKYIKLLKGIKAKKYIITETGVFNVKFHKDLTYEQYYKNLAKKLQSAGFKVELVLYECNFGMILINQEHKGGLIIEKNTYTNLCWRDYVSVLKDEVLDDE